MVDEPADPENAGAGPAETAYSKAFESFVEDDDDLEGLLAYALFKRSVWESCSSGRPVDPMRRDPSPSTVRAFRREATGRLEDFAIGVVQDNLDRTRAEAEAAAREMAERLLGGTTDQVSKSVAGAVVELQRGREETDRLVNSKATEISTAVRALDTPRRDFWTALGTNLLAWVITLAVAALLYFSQRGEEVAEAQADRIIAGRNRAVDVQEEQVQEMPTLPAPAPEPPTTARPSSGQAP